MKLGVFINILYGGDYMKSVDFMGKNIICWEEPLVCNTIIKTAQLFNLTGRAYEYADKDEWGRYVMVTEEELAVRALIAGKGVAYRECVYFLIDKPTESHYNRYKAVKAKYFKEDKLDQEQYGDYLGGIVYNYLFDKKDFGVAKFYIDLYITSDIYSFETIYSKLNRYLPALIVDQIMQEERRMAG